MKILKKILLSTYLFLRDLKALFADTKKYNSYKEQFLMIPGCSDISLDKYYGYGNLIKIAKPLVQYYDELYELILEKVRA